MTSIHFFFGLLSLSFGRSHRSSATKPFSLLALMATFMLSQNSGRWDLQRGWVDDSPKTPPPQSFQVTAMLSLNNGRNLPPPSSQDNRGFPLFPTSNLGSGFQRSSDGPTPNPFLATPMPSVHPSFPSQTPQQLQPLNKHPNVYCNNCQTFIGSKERYKCLDCPDFDLCGPCEPGGSKAHCNGTHLFMKLRDSTPFTQEYLNSYTKGNLNK